MTDDMTIQGLLDSLVEADFLSDSRFGYQAVLKDRGEAVTMDLDKTLLGMVDAMVLPSALCQRCLIWLPFCKGCFGNVVGMYVNSVQLCPYRKL